jgi:hypothetical protein
MESKNEKNLTNSNPVQCVSFTLCERIEVELQHVKMRLGKKEIP